MEEETKIPRAILHPTKPGWAISPSGLEFQIRVCTRRTFWMFGGRIPRVEILNAAVVAKKYFYVPMYFYDEATGQSTFFEESLAQAAWPMVSYGYAKIVGYEATD